MRFLFPRLTAVALAVVLTAPALAQRAGADGGNQQIAFLSYLSLSNKSVQDELKLTDDQKAALQKIKDERTEAGKKVRKDLDREAKMAAALAIVDKASKAAEKILKPTQAKRLKQITLQRMGPRALTFPAIQKELKLTEKQVAEIKGIHAAGAKLQEQLKKAGSDREKRREVFNTYRKIIQEMRAKADEEIVKVLTPQQKKKWQEMQGPKFDYKRNPRKSAPTEKKDD